MFSRNLAFINFSVIQSALIFNWESYTRKSLICYVVLYVLCTNTSFCFEENFMGIKVEEYDSIMKFGYCFDESISHIWAFI